MMSARLLLLFALAFAYTQSYLLRTINAVLAPTLQQDFQLNNSDLGLLSAAYFIAFAAIQIPLGPLLDRYGTRRVESVLLLIAALGALIFGLSSDFYGLMLGRLLIGLGVSACLMGAFKSFREHFPLNQQGRLSIFMLFFGSTGALLATQPTHWALGFVEWRTLFFGIAATLALGAYGLWRWVPPPIQEVNASEPNKLPASYRTVLSSAIFWQSVPVYAVMVGGYLALQSLWCGPWFMEAAKMSAGQSSQSLLYMALIQLLGFLLLGFIIAPWASRKQEEMNLVKVAFLVAVLSLWLATLDPRQWGLWGFMGFALFFSTSTISQTILNATFPNHVVGRASTASNFLIFLGAFFFQWSLGILIDQWVLHGASRGDASNQAMQLMAGLMSLSWLWYTFSGKRWAPWVARQFEPK